MSEAATTCRDVRSRIDALLPQDLDGERLDETIRGHLDQCAGCRAYLAKSRSLAAALGAWEVPEPRRNIHAGVMTAIARREHDRRRGELPGGFRERCAALFGYRFRVPAAAAAALLVLLGLSLTWNFVQFGRSRAERSTLARADRTVFEPRVGAITGMVTPTVATERDLTRLVARYESGKEPEHPAILRPGPVSVPVIVILGIPPWLYPQPALPAPRSRPISDSQPREGNI